METKALPTVPGKSPGVVRVELDAEGKTRYTLQCGNCHALETPRHLVLLRTHFHRRGEDRRRLCPPCRLELFPDCTCDHCLEDQGKSIY